MSDIFTPYVFADSITALKTATATTSEVFAGSSAMEGRSRLTIRSRSADTRLRVYSGAAPSPVEVQRDGEIIDTLDTLTIYPTGTVWICSEGRPQQYIVEEA